MVRNLGPFVSVGSVPFDSFRDTPYSGRRLLAFRTASRKASIGEMAANDRFHRSNLRLLIHTQKLVAMSIDELVKRRTDKITEISRLDYLIRVTNQPLIERFY